MGGDLLWKCWVKTAVVVDFLFVDFVVADLWWWLSGENRCAMGRYWPSAEMIPTLPYYTQVGALLGTRHGSCYWVLQCRKALFSFFALLGTETHPHAESVPALVVAVCL